MFECKTNCSINFFLVLANCNLGIPSNGKSRVLRVKNVVVTNLLLYGNIYVGIHIYEIVLQ